MAVPTAPLKIEAPVFPDDLSSEFAGMIYRNPMRRYQSLALEAFERARLAGRRRTYVAMPPGSGKTVLGLEMARRLGRPTLVLGPNTAIQAQWLSQWGDFVPPQVAASPDPDLSAPMTVLTYQAICVLDRDVEGVDDGDGGDDEADEVGADDAATDALPAADSTPATTPADAAHDRARARRLIARGGDREQVLGLLHPNGRRIVERIAAGGGWTLILDECHHLLELWGHLIEAILAEIGADAFVIGLTATPPSDMEGQAAALYRRLFGQADFEVVTPAVVKEGNLAPYQELAYLTTPLPMESAYVHAEQERFDALITDVLDPSFASRPFLVWLDDRVVRRTTAEGARVGWERIEADEPDLAQAALRLLWSRNLPLPADAHVREQHRRPPTADDWMVLLDGYVREVLDPGAGASVSADAPAMARADGVGGAETAGSEAAAKARADAAESARKDAAARERIRRALPSIGYSLTRDGIRAAASPVDRVLALSASKGVAAIEILDAELQVLGDHLRALLLCDYEVAGREVGARLAGVLDPQAGSAALLMHTLLSSRVTRDLDPVLVTGRTVACSRATAVDLVRWAAEADPELGPALQTSDPLADASARGPAWEDLVEIRPDDSRWTPRRYVPLVTRFFEEGRTHCLVGTRGLLGEGWDARSVNVLIDLTAAATATSVHQMRGRSLRLDPSLPHKVADNWDVVCVAPDHAQGMADYARFVRKHRSYFALTASGEIESGVSQVDPTLSPYGPPDASSFQDLDGRMLARVDQRERAYAAWRIGQPYANIQAETLRVHMGRSPGLPGRDLLRGQPRDRRESRVRWVAAAAAGLGVAAVVVGAALSALIPGLLVGLFLTGAGGAWAIGTVRDGLARLQPSDTLEDIAAALAEALASTALIARGMGEGHVRINPGSDGYYRCWLDGATEADAATFASALDELLEPLAEPRRIIPRRVAEPTSTLLGTLTLLLRRAARRGPPGLEVWHAVPSVIATRKDHVAGFQASWRRWVSPGAVALPAKDPRAQAVLELHRGDDPFSIETQMRTLWS